MNKKIMEALNEDVALELAASIRYFWHYITAKGTVSPEIRDRFRKISIVEMKHAEKFAERLNYLGGVPTVQPAPIKLGNDLKKQMQLDLEAERNAIRQYKAHLKLVDADDVVTRRLLEKIIGDEEEHEDLWMSVLGRGRAGKNLF